MLKTQYPLRFIHQQRGGLAIIFAIILPFIFSCCALTFDGARILSKKARLADALNEAALAIATGSSSNPDAEEKIKLKILLNNYIDAYLPGETIKSSDIIFSYVIDPDTGTTLPVFDIRANIDVKTILPLDIVPAFSPNINLSNKGKVRKGLQDLGRPADYVFVLDFSGSMTDLSAQSGMSRLALLKKVVKDVTTAALESYPDTTFTLVPFDTGTLVKYKSQDSLLLNEAGGVLNGCSTLMVPQKFQHPLIKDLVEPEKNMEIGYDIDFDFWSDKAISLWELPAPDITSTQLPYTIDDVKRLIDFTRYNYYNIYVLGTLKKSTPGITMDSLVTMGWCVRNESIPLNSKTHAPYSCEKDKSRSIHAPENQDKIKREMERARRYAYGNPYQDVYSIVNGNSIDVDATINGMFDERNIITFALEYWNTRYLAKYMCYTAAPQDGSYTTNQLDLVTRNAYLIGPTNDLNELEQFQTMTARGNTISSSGFFRALPEMVKGNNPRTVLIVVSDGDDNNNDILDLIHKNRPDGNRICDRIRSDLKTHKPITEDVEIYFISVVDGVLDRQRTKYWADYCTGDKNAIIATNYDDLMKKLIEIMNQYEETGYFYN